MKTAISIPDSLFAEAEQLAQRLGVSRSELYATALKAYVETHHADHLTRRLNALYPLEDSSVDVMRQQLPQLALPQAEW